MILVTDWKMPSVINGEKQDLFWALFSRSSLCVTKSVF